MKKNRKKTETKRRIWEISLRTRGELELLGISASHSELDGHGAHGREEEIFVAQELLHLFFSANMTFSHQQMKRE